jgi:hypothetical protein
MSSSNEQQRRTEELIERQHQINLEIERLMQAQLPLEHDSPAWELLEEKQRQLVCEFNDAQDELDSIQHREELSNLLRLGWKLSKREAIDGYVFSYYVPPDSPEVTE